MSYWFIAAFSDSDLEDIDADDEYIPSDEDEMDDSEGERSEPDQPRRCVPVLGFFSWKFLEVYFIKSFLFTVI